LTYLEWIEHLESKLELLNSIIKLAEQGKGKTFSSSEESYEESSEDDSLTSFVMLFNEDQEANLEQRSHRS